MLDEAVKSYRSALGIQEKINDRQGQGRSLNNIGSVYLMQGKHMEALDNFTAAIEIKEEIGDVASIGRSYLNVGDIYFLFAHDKTLSAHKRDSLLAEARTNFEKALVALERIGDKQTMAGTYNNLGLLFVAKKNPKLAREFTLKGLALATEVGSPDDIKSSYNGLAVVDSMTGDYKSSLAHYKKFIEYRDKLVNKENTQKTLQARMDFELEQKDLKTKAEREKREIVHQAELARKEAEVSRKELQGWSIGGGITLFLLIFLLLLNRSRLKQKHQYQQQLNRQQKEKATAILDTQEQERKRIAEDLHDSLGHLLSTAKMNLQSGSTDLSRQTIQLLNQASEELRNISFNLMPRVLEEEGLTPALNELAEKTQQSGKMMVSFQAHDLEKFSFDRLAQFNIYRIVQEATNNILKHAGATETGIQLIGQENNLVIMIEDNGKGFDPNKVQHGRGQRNMRARTQWLNGNFHLDSTPGHGTTISIEIPAYA
jgi:signal transduction histidine kinase